MNVSGSGSFQTSINGTLSPVQPVAIAGTASVSCTSATFCVAVGSESANANVFDGSGFSATGNILSSSDDVSGLTGVSCVGTFCAAIDGADVYASNGGLAWTTGQPFDAAHDAVGISCASTTFFAAVDSGGDAYLLDPSFSLESRP